MPCYQGTGLGCPVALLAGFPSKSSTVFRASRASDRDGRVSRQSSMNQRQRTPAKWTVRVIHGSWKNCIQTNRDTLDVLRHIIKNISERLVQLIVSPLPELRKGFLKLTDNLVTYDRFF